MSVARPHSRWSQSRHLAVERCEESGCARAPVGFLIEQVRRGEEEQRRTIGGSARRQPAVYELPACFFDLAHEPAVHRRFDDLGRLVDARKQQRLLSLTFSCCCWSGSECGVVQRQDRSESLPAVDGQLRVERCGHLQEEEEEEEGGGLPRRHRRTD